MAQMTSLIIIDSIIFGLPKAEFILVHLEKVFRVIKLVYKMNFSLPSTYVISNYYMFEIFHMSVNAMMNACYSYAV